MAERPLAGRPGLNGPGKSRDNCAAYLGNAPLVRIPESTESGD